MSRFSLKIKDSEVEAKEFIVGYDNPLGGYFFQVFGKPDEDGEDTWVEPREQVSDRLKILRMIEKYADPDNQLNIAVRQAVMFHQDPKELLTHSFDHWSRYPTSRKILVSHIEWDVEEGQADSLPSTMEVEVSGQDENQEICDQLSLETGWCVLDYKKKEE